MSPIDKKHGAKHELVHVFFWFKMFSLHICIYSLLQVKRDNLFSRPLIFHTIPILPHFTYYKF